MEARGRRRRAVSFIMRRRCRLLCGMEIDKLCVRDFGRS
jgi:hypothetical protein